MTNLIGSETVAIVTVYPTGLAGGSDSAGAFDMGRRRRTH